MTTLRDERGYASAAIFASLLLHLLLAWCLLQHVVDVTPAPRFVSVALVRLQPVPKPKLPVVKQAAPSAPPVPKPVAHAAPAPIVHARPQVHVHQARPAPPVGHFGISGAEAGLGLDLGSPSGGNGQGSIGGFDDAVKQRIEAAKTYPPGIPYMWNECVVEYQVTVNQTGQLLSYKLYGCDDPFLDSAARAAILMASPFPVPPNFGGSKYTVFGSLVFKHH